ncbi:MAG: hypothetical protein AAF721_36760 [Myxococcota bacterium]
MQRLLPSLLIASLCACGAERTIYNDPGADGNVAAVLEAAANLDDDGDDGPSGAGLSCPPLPDGRPLMPDLSVGWAAQGANTTLLQFGTHPFACGVDVAMNFAGADACPPLWAFEILVDTDAVAPGEFELTTDNPGQLVQFERSGNGCARDTVRSSSQGFRGGIVIHAVNDECVVGEFVDLDFPTDDLADISGVFVAERC